MEIVRVFLEEQMIATVVVLLAIGVLIGEVYRAQRARD